MTDESNVIPMPKPEEQFKFLSVAEMLAQDDTEFQTVEMWPGKFVRIASLTAGDLIKFTEDGKKSGNTAGLRLALQSLVDGDGKRIANVNMIEQFKNKNSKTMTKLVTAVLKLNALSKDGVDVAEHLKACRDEEGVIDIGKLKKLGDELAALAKQVHALVVVKDGVPAVDADALQKLIDDPAEARAKAAREDAKNDSGETT